VYKKREKIEKVTGSQDDDFVGVLRKNVPNKGSGEICGSLNL
jgi:hypothetical protein